MRLSLLFDQLRWEEKALIRAAQARDVELTPVDAKALRVDVVNKKTNVELGGVALQRCVSYFRSLHLSAALEGLGVRVVNPFSVTLVCGNKLLTTLSLVKAGVPTPTSVVAFTPEAVLDLLAEAKREYVLKPVVGSWGRMLAPLKDVETAEAILEGRMYMHPLYQVFYAQERVGRPPRDIRATVVGDEVVAAIYRISPPGKFRTSIARGGRAEPCAVTDELRELSLRAAKAVGGGVLGVDLMESPQGYLVHEVNHTIEFAATVGVTKVDVPGFIVDYAIGQGRR